MQYTLRPYQQEAVGRAIDFFHSNEKSAIQILGTGLGKSLILANIAKNLSGNTLIFSPTREILSQNHDKLLSYDPFIDVKIFSASFNSKEIGKLTFATIGSAINKKELFNHFDNILIDEAHGVGKTGMYKEFLSNFKHKKVLGVTATPYRLSVDGFGGAMLKFITRTNPREFDKVNYYCQIGEMQKQGYLAETEYYQTGGFDTGKLVVNSTKQDYTDDSVKMYYHEINFEDKIANVVMRLLNAGRKNILVFTRFVEEARYVKEKLGDICEMVSGDTPKNERDQILKDFKSGKIKVVANAQVLVLGFDYPALDTVVLARATRSLSMYYQMIGRCVRPHESKKSAWIVDMCGTYNRFGKVENLVLKNDGGNQWYYHNGKERLTNVYLR